ncbi:MAG: SIS domain-containing protein [Ruminococcaceae bacterium]|nr:SIS domain-containing protein [Oscillospiraceae bacterium]
MIKSAQYYNALTKTLADINETQGEKIALVAKNVAKTIENDGIIYVFGCGHSHLIAGDVFYRAGGLANVCAMLDTDLMLHNGAAKSSAFERMEGLAEHIYRRYNPTEKDCLFVVSSSGINSVPVEMATIGRKHGVFTTAICSSAYFDKESRHSSGKLLYQCADVYLDNCVPCGDAVVEIGDIKMGAVSTAASSLILNSVLLEAADIASRTTEVPIYKSGNVKGGSEYNKQLIDRYIPRIKHL